MKVLFAVNNDEVSEAIVKKYQKEYKEILSYKNVYYFNAILRELQKDKSYSRIVISEDLEPFANNNYDSIDKFLYEKYSAITEETKNTNNDQIEIILICADRRKRTDDMLIKIYKKGIYSALIGQDRSVDAVCRLINRPRDKENAKGYYNIKESELGGETGNGVSEAELQNILAHYKRLGKNEDKYVESFNNIVTQYTDAQLRIIIKYLPMNVKAVLEEKSPKYQQLVMSYGMSGFDAKKRTMDYKDKIQEAELNDKKDEIDDLIKTREVRDVVVPKTLTTQKVQKVVIPDIVKQKIQKEIIIESDETLENQSMEILEVESENEMETSNTSKNNSIEEKNEQVVATPKKGRGRPRKNPLPIVEEEKTKRGRGRPKKQVPEDQKIENNTDQGIDIVDIDTQATSKEKTVDLFSLNEHEEIKNNEIDLFNLDSGEKPVVKKKKLEDNDINLFDIESNSEQEVNLFEMDDSDDDTTLVNVDNSNNEQEVNLFDTDDTSEEEDLFNPVEIKKENYRENVLKSIDNESKNEENNNYITNTNNIEDTNFKTLLTGNKKIVAFVGTTKNGTSFIVNNTAEMLASMGIETAILDMTKSKNAYYIYTNNEESLRITAKKCMDGLQNGRAEGIKVNKNLTVYTEMPGEEKEYNISKILTTLLQNYSAILIDTDFDTPDEIFEKSQEIYLVQTMDVLTIQPLTAFLRNLKSRNVLKPEKLRIVINKSQKVRSLNIKTLIGGMSCYNSPSMTYMTELFNKDTIRYCEIPFEVQNYVKYLDSLVNCTISLNGYTKLFINSLKELANMVYPLVNKQTYSPMNKKNPRDPFSNQVNETLNKMKSKY